MPSFALDTARFIEMHAKGHESYSSSRWHLKPLVTCSDEERREFGFLSPEFKKEFTEQSGLILTLGRVPSGVTVRWYDQPIYTEESIFLFGFRRCYLSENWNDNSSRQMFIKNSDSRPFDLMREFRFTGEYLFQKTGPGRSGVRIDGDDPDQVVCKLMELQKSDQMHYIVGELPAEWITHVVSMRLDGGYTLLPVPSWEVDFEITSGTAVI
jgi:hypothetical protein